MSINRKLAQKLSEWSALGLISPEQAKSIERHELETESKHGFIFAISLLAACCIVLGIVALIASNWAEIPAALKLSVFFVSFAGLSALLVFREKNTALISEVLRLALMGLVFGGIGLVAQIYHLHSSPWKGLAFWSGCTILLALSSTSIWGAGLWLTMSLFALVSYLDSLHLHVTMDTAIFTLCVGAIGILATLPWKRFPNLIHFRKVGFVYASLATVVFTILTGYRFDAIMDMKVYVSLLSMFFLWGLAVQLTPTLYSPQFRMTFFTFLFAAAMQVVLLPFFGENPETNILRKLLTTLLFTGGTLGLGLSAFYFGSKRIFELTCLFIFTRLLIFYAELFMSLSLTGFALISMGIIIFAGLWAWHKWKNVIFAKLEKKSHG
ncbi:MAG: DUF2157 domain-containing protein [Proteobacteria bacterium]|nr:MAG: DUF2157 domain-containing protein [Pseudomonadota bacterium]